MPIEIKELIIKAFVNEGAEPVNQQSSTAEQPVNNMETVIAACVEQVLQILKDKEER